MRCAKIQYRTRTRVTCYGNTTGIPVLVRNPSPFALDNIDLIKKAKKEGEDDDDDDDDDTSPIGTKRAHTVGGRITKGEDFWARVDAFFVNMIKERGRSFVGNRWKE